MPGNDRRSVARIFRAPLAIGVASGIGLVSALVGDGVFDVLSWIMLALPPVFCLAFIARAAN